MAALTVLRSPSLATLLLLLLLAIVILLTFPTRVAAISFLEYDAMQRVLRNRGYNLVCNAMATSDLQYEILTLPPNDTFTIFAPTDASLFALDMIQTASSYTETLRLNFVPLRLSLSDLRSISTGSILPTLLPSTALRLSTDPLAVAGVDVTLPGLFYSRHVAVHGLAGIISLSSAVTYGPNIPATAPVASGGADEVAPLKTVSNRTDLSPAATPPSEAAAPTTTDSNRTASANLSPAGAASPVTAVPPSPTARNITLPAATPPSEAAAPTTNDSNRTAIANLSPAGAASPVTVVPPSPTARNITSPASDLSPSTSPPSADSVPKRALLLEITDDGEDSDGDEVPVKSELVMELEAVKMRKCGSLDEMTVGCFVSDEDGGWTRPPQRSASAWSCYGLKRCV